MDEPVSFTLSTGGHVIAYGSAGQSASFVVASGQAISIAVTGGTPSSTLCGTITGTVGKGEPPPLQYAQSRGGAAIDLNPADIAVEFPGLAPSSVGKVTGLAAPASHAHAMNALGRKVKGFGTALELSTAVAGGTPAGGIGSPRSLPAMSEFCLEFWSYVVGANVNGAEFMGLQTVPASQRSFANGDYVIGWTDNSINGSYGGIIWPDGTQDHVNTPPLTGAPFTHWAITGDGTTLRAFQNGTLIASHAQSGPVAGYLNFIQSNCNTELYLDEVRLSSVARYTAAFSVPTEPFVADAATVILWSFDDLPLGEFVSNSSGATTTYPDTSADSSGNGNTVTLVTFAGNGGGSLYTDGLTASGLISTVTSTSGVGTAYSVLSLQAQRGDLVLTDTAGNSVATPVPQTDGTIQLQMAALSAGATPWTSIPYWLLRVD
jgi:hypothetical protein